MGWKEGSAPNFANRCQRQTRAAEWLLCQRNFEAGQSVIVALCYTFDLAQVDFDYPHIILENTHIGFHQRHIFLNKTHVLLEKTHVLLESTHIFLKKTHIRFYYEQLFLLAAEFQI